MRVAYSFISSLHSEVRKEKDLLIIMFVLDSSIYTAGVRVWRVLAGNGTPELYLHPRV